MEQYKNNLKVIHYKINNHYRVQVIKDIKLHYVNIMAHLKDVVMAINANLLMVMQN